MIKNLNQVVLPQFKMDKSEQSMNELLEAELVEVRKYLKDRENAKNEKTLEEQVRDAKKKYISAQNLYESYDAAKFEVKTRVDLLFFEHVCQNLPEVKKMPELISNYYRTVKSLYEMVNMKPENHKMLKPSVLNESYANQQKIFAKILSEHTNNNYYRFSKETRVEKFINESQEYASVLVEKGMETQQAIQVAIKAALLESLISGIAIPKFVQRRIKFLCEDADYGKVFDQEKLKSLWESFLRQSKNVSRILAAAI